MEGMIADLDRVSLLELVMLCAIMAVGVHASYTDIRWREIANGATWGLLAVGVLGQLGFWMMGETELEQVVLIVGAGFGVAYLLYAYGFWAPGDAKLFWGVVVALPPTLFPPGPFFSFDAPLWAVLVNALLVNLVVVVLRVAVRRVRGVPAWPERAAGEPREAVGWPVHGLRLAGASGLTMGLGLVLAEPLTFVEAAVTVTVGYLLLDRFLGRRYQTAVTAPGVVVGGYACWSAGGWTVFLSLWLLSWVVHSAHAVVLRRDATAVGQARGVEPEPGARGDRPEVSVPFAPAIAAAAVLAVLLGSSVIQPLSFALHHG